MSGIDVDKIAKLMKSAASYMKVTEPQREGNKKFLDKATRSQAALQGAGIGAAIGGGGHMIRNLVEDIPTYGETVGSHLGGNLKSLGKYVGTGAIIGTGVGIVNKQLHDYKKKLKKLRARRGE